MFYFFKKGDPVPQWLEHTDMIMTFEVDVLVHKLEDIAHVFPFEEEYNYVIKGTTSGGFNENVYVKGYPTVIHKSMEIFLSNYEEQYQF